MCSNWQKSKNMLTHHYIQEVRFRSLGNAAEKEEAVTTFDQFGAVL